MSTVRLRLVVAVSRLSLCGALGLLAACEEPINDVGPDTAIFADVFTPEPEMADRFTSVLGLRIISEDAYYVRENASPTAISLSLSDLVAFVQKQQQFDVIALQVEPSTTMGAVYAALRSTSSATNTPIILNAPGSDCGYWLGWPLQGLGRVNVLVDSMHNHEGLSPECRIVGQTRRAIW